MDKSVQPALVIPCPTATLLTSEFTCWHFRSQLPPSATPVSGISLPDDTLLTSLYNSELILRQKEVHFFLKKFLQLYSSSSIDEFPKELLCLENLPLSEKDLRESSAKGAEDSKTENNIFN
ncbi:Cilia- and flagella-associated protein 54 [Saguinus oedipus]|uniref:Cilia- and flagella-associated protein 54 n=1 Tax=Saguinus oedipus TaxID=9490 RepID=A0ABQ9UZ83_SAGOE|nr:Cilia- and flagella-associated protein 54 [Saguinus oedipus]